MRVLKTIEGLKCFLAQCRHPLDDPSRSLPSIGLVPTMGALHRGHLSLIDQARGDSDVVIVSIFVNPLQFAPGEDLERYPQQLAQDLRLCEQGAVDAVFAPTPELLYGSGSPEGQALFQITPPPAMISGLCGKFRPGHFTGVATVVLKLLNLVQPQQAYFGQKDAQQLAILKRLAQDLNLPVRIIGCPTFRDSDGLALSSRNQYLAAAERQQALGLNQALQAAAALFEQGERRRQPLLARAHSCLDVHAGIQVQYLDLVHPDTLKPLDVVTSKGLIAVAAHIGSTRLIDNTLLRSRQPIIAIDGPAGAGKSTVARRVAGQLDLLYLDTGAMYRAVTWLALDRGLDVEDEVAVAELMPDCDIQLSSGGIAMTGARVWVNGDDVTQTIRSREVTRRVSTVAAQPVVRESLLQRQRLYGLKGGIVMEGRDIGTQVFPEAELKIFLTASVAERARRRQRDLQQQNQPPMTLEDLERAIDERDRKDSTRRIAPLRKAADAVELITDGLSIDEVVGQIVSLFSEHQENSTRFDAN